MLTASHRGVARVDHDWGLHHSRLIARRVTFGNLTVVAVSARLEHSAGLGGMSFDLQAEPQEFLAASPNRLR